MRLTKLSAFRKIIFAPGSAPAMKTLRARISAGAFPGGCKVDGRYYVDLDVFEGKTSGGTEETNRRDARARIVAEINELNNNPLLAGLVGPKKR